MTTRLPPRTIPLSTGSNPTIAGYCAHMLLLWIHQYERLLGFDVEA